MRLCNACGHVDEHEDCPLEPPATAAPERVARVLAAVAEARETLARIEAIGGDQPRMSVLRILSTEALLERNPSRHLSAFDAKRAHNEVATRLAASREEFLRALPEGESRALVEDFRFCRKALELLHAVALRRLEAGTFDATALGRLATVPVVKARVKGATVSELCTELEQRLDETRQVDAQVSTWGWSNLEPLAAGREPTEIPPELQKGGFLGSLLGRGASQRLALAAQFKLLGDRFRERLYLIGSNTILQRLGSRFAQATEAWKKHLSREDGARRWDRIKAQGKDLIVYFLADAPADLTKGAESVMNELVRATTGEATGFLRTFDSLATEEWDTLAKSYALALRSVEEGSSAGDALTVENVARTILERVRGREPDVAEHARVLESVAQAWRAGPKRR